MKPQEIIRAVMDLCADCDTCRFLMEEDCVFFPELYRLWDQEKEGGIPISEAQLRRLVDLCTLCGLCPCPRIAADVMEAKSRYIELEGLPLAVRLFSDVPRMARLCGTLPRLINALKSNSAVANLLRKVLRIHPKRELPSFPQQSFFAWAADRGLNRRREGCRTVAYYAGCTAGYLFPQVGRAVVEVLERNGVTVWVPPQNCCGMPQLVEGQRTAALRLARSNMEQLLEAVHAGDDLVCSCSTCGFYMKQLIKDRAHFSEEYQRSVNAGEDELKVPAALSGGKKLMALRKSIYRQILKDDGYFSSIDPMGRISLAEHLSDAGEYLARLHSEDSFNTSFNAIPERMAYYAPCHQREQKMGRPYPDLLRLIPGITVEVVGGEMDCCGMGGNFGFKADFHDHSLALGQHLMAKIRKLAPQAIITDCMSCRLQFSHALPYPVFHPVEILARAYQS